MQPVVQNPFGSPDAPYTVPETIEELMILHRIGRSWQPRRASTGTARSGGAASRACYPTAGRDFRWSEPARGDCSGPGAQARLDRAGRDRFCPRRHRAGPGTRTGWSTCNANWDCPTCSSTIPWRWSGSFPRRACREERRDRRERSADCGIRIRENSSLPFQREARHTQLSVTHFSQLLTVVSPGA